MFWNPFAHLMGSKEYPFSRVVHVPFLKRIKNTFEVFFGYGKDDYPREKCYDEEKLGLLDYVFPFPLLFKKVCSAVPILWIILGIPYAVSLIIEFIAAVALTLLVSPVVLIVHLCTKPTSHQYEEDVMQLKVIDGEKETTIENLLRETPEVRVTINEGLDEVIGSALIPPPKLTVRRLGKDENKNDNEAKNKQIYLYLSRTVPSCYTLGDPVAKVAMTSENYKGLSALCKGNFFKVEDCISKRPTVDGKVSRLKPNL